MTGNQAHTQPWLLIENCTTSLYFLLTFIINLQGTFTVCVCNQQNLWVLPGPCPPPLEQECLTPITPPGCFSLPTKP